MLIYVRDTCQIKLEIKMHDMMKPFLEFQAFYEIPQKHVATVWFKYNKEKKKKTTTFEEEGSLFNFIIRHR